MQCVLPGNETFHPGDSSSIPTVGDCHQLGNLDCLLIVSQYVFYYPIYHFDCHEVVPERDPAGSLIIREQSPLLKCSCCVLGLAGQLEEPLVVLLWTLCHPSIAILLPYLGFYCHEIVTGNIPWIIIEQSPSFEPLNVMIQMF
mgnify:CR=1 FL=1